MAAIPAVPPPAPSVRAIVLNAASLIGTTGVTSALGAAFWFVAARQFSRDDLGTASAAISALTLLGSLSTLGFSTMLIGELRNRSHDARSVVTASLAFTAAVGAVAGLAFALLAPQVSTELAVLSASLGGAAFFAAGVAASAAGEVLDGAVIGILSGRLQLWRNTIFAVAKLALLVLAIAVITDPGVLDIYAVWVLGIVVSLALIAGLRVLSTRDSGSYLPRRGVLKGLPRLALAHQAFNVAYKIPSFVLPLIVVSLISASANASFYVSFMIAGFLYMVPNALTTVLFAVGASDPRALADRIRMTLRLSTIAAAAGSLVLFVAAEPILSIFGDGYTSDAWVLRLLALATFPLTVKTHYLAITRIYRRMRSSMALVWVGTMAELAFAVVGAKVDGVDGVALLWLAAVVLEAIVMAPTVVRAARGHDFAAGAAIPPAAGAA